MAHAGSGPPSKCKRKGDSAYRKRALASFLKPSGLRAFILGVSLAVGGFAGGIRILMEGVEVIRGVAALGIGIMGSLIALSCVLENSKR